MIGLGSIWPMVSGAGWPGAQGTVRAFRVVVFPPLFDQDLGFAQALEDFAFQELVAEPGIEALTVSVLPGAARFDLCRPGSSRFDPILYSLSDELWTVIRTGERRHAAQDEQVTEDIDDIA